MRIWRLTRRKHQATAFDGEGAARVGGRWNSRGTRVAYCSSSRALCALEYLVHVDPADIPKDLVLMACTFADKHVTEIETLGALPKTWKSYPISPAAQKLGDAWAKAKLGLVLSVPSTLVNERNYILNPQHPHFVDVVTGPVEPFVFDERLFKSGHA